MSTQKFYLSTSILQKASACPRGIAFFKHVFGTKVILSRKNYYKWLLHPWPTFDDQRNYVYWLIMQIDDDMRTRAGREYPELRFYSQNWREFSRRYHNRFNMSHDELYDFLMDTVKRCYKIRTDFNLGSIEDL